MLTQEYREIKIRNQIIPEAIETFPENPQPSEVMKESSEETINQGQQNVIYKQIEQPISIQSVEQLSPKGSQMVERSQRTDSFITQENTTSIMYSDVQYTPRFRNEGNVEQTYVASISMVQDEDISTLQVLSSQIHEDSQIRRPEMVN